MDVRVYEGSRGFAVYFNVEDVHAASLDSLPARVADHAGYVEAVGPSGARVLKNRRGPTGFISASTEPKGRTP